ncbi:MAG: T9SS type A sorting domain-containing protein [Bacteroidia bacterium]|nr:T9SS type A sorting domain-containing protein [Bacteroidia bacterium]
MKKLYFLSLLLWIPRFQAQAQTVSCTDQPFEYFENLITYQSSGGISFGDYYLGIPIKNTTSSNYAYPQAKLVPITPLPDGLVLNPSGDVWIVFASSWNIDSTSIAQVFFDQTQALAPNASASFELWMKNLSPLTIDSCKFDQTFTFNFNPQPNSVNTIEDFIPYAYFQQESLVIGQNEQVKSLRISDVSGKNISLSSKSMESISLPAGLYIITFETKGGKIIHQKVIKQ